MSSRERSSKGWPSAAPPPASACCRLRADAEPGARADAGVLDGTEFDLRIGQTRVERHRPRAGRR